MDKVLFVSYNHSKLNVADSVQNHRLITALKEYYDIELIKRACSRGNDGIWTPNLYWIDRVLYKIFPFLISIFSIDAYIWSKKAFNSIKDRLAE